MAGRIATRSDCAQCAALCCIAYPSEDMPGFAAHKQAGEPCPNLDACGACTIYEDRARLGFAGCIAFECFGAGQFVTQTVFGGRDWRTDPSAMPAMVDTFLRLRPAFDLLYLAETFSGGDPACESEMIRQSLEDALLSPDPHSAERLLHDAKARLRALYAARRESQAAETG